MIKARLKLQIMPQPDETTCGPTCLQSIYNYYDDPAPLADVISEVTMFSGGGTLAVFLALHALKRGYSARIYTFNLHVFDPTWASLDTPGLMAKLEEQMRAKNDQRIIDASKAYLEFLSLGGKIEFQNLTASLIRSFLKKSKPILTGLSATYLYQTARERHEDAEYDDIRGYPVGHFVVLCGYDAKESKVTVADPLRPNPLSEESMYSVGMSRLITSVLLGIVTYDANFLVIEPKRLRGRRAE